MDKCGKSRPHRDSIPGPSSPKPVEINRTEDEFFQDEHLNLYSQSRTIRAIKFRRLRCAEHVARVSERKGMHTELYYGHLNVKYFFINRRTSLKRLRHGM
jgi:hypothetical protein